MERNNKNQITVNYIMHLSLGQLLVVGVSIGEQGQVGRINGEMRNKTTQGYETLG